MIVITTIISLQYKESNETYIYLHCSCKKVVEKLSKENLKVIKNTCPNKSGNLENLQK